jgi:hypothetical protein
MPAWRPSVARTLGAVSDRAVNRRSVPLPPYVEGALDAALDAALRVQRPVIVAYLNRVRERHSDADPDEVVRLLERRYRSAVTAVGAASGGAAVLLGAGTGLSLASAALEISAFVEATALFALAMAEVHGLRTEDPHVRRALVLAILVGDAGGKMSEIAGSDATSGWAHVLAQHAPDETVRRVNHTLGKHVLPRFGIRQEALALGRALPFGIGAGIGAVGNAVLAHGVISAARRVFGTPPLRLPPRVIEGRLVEAED